MKLLKSLVTVTVGVLILGRAVHASDTGHDADNDPAPVSHQRPDAKSPSPKPASVSLTQEEIKKQLSEILSNYAQAEVVGVYIKELKAFLLSAKPGVAFEKELANLTPAEAQQKLKAAETQLEALNSEIKEASETLYSKLIQTPKGVDKEDDIYGAFRALKFHGAIARNDMIIHRHERLSKEAATEKERESSRGMVAAMQRVNAAMKKLMQVSKDVILSVGD